MMHHSLCAGSWDTLGMKYDQFAHLRLLSELVHLSVHLCAVYLTTITLPACVIHICVSY